MAFPSAAGRVDTPATYESSVVLSLESDGLWIAGYRIPSVALFNASGSGARVEGHPDAVEGYGPIGTSRAGL